MLGCKALSEIEIKQILEHLNFRDSVLFSLGLNTGYRISELLSIRVKDIRDAHGNIVNEISVAKKNMKGKHTGRSVPLSDDTKTLLNTYLKTLPSDQMYLFESQKGTKLSRCQAWRSIKVAVLKAKLTGKIATHSARKTVAMRAYEASGKDLALTQAILGHKQITSTIAYLNVNEASVKDLWLKIQKVS